jgi:hypothetical protein
VVVTFFDRLLSEEKSAGVASLRGQGTPAYPARLRSERARNSSRIFSTARPIPAKKYFLGLGQETAQENFPPKWRKAIQELLLPQGGESAASSACGFFAAAEDRAAVNQEAGDFPSIETFFRGR